MAAIFGIIQKNEAPIEQSTIDRAGKALQHRAHAGSLHWQQPGIFLWQTNDAASCQSSKVEAATLELGEYVIVADATLHNKTALLKLLGFHHPNNDPFPTAKVILSSFLKWGKSCVNYFEGEFAFVIWHKESKQLFAAVDHIGTRPFYYYYSNQCFIFCSELKGVEAAKTSPDYFNEEHLIEYHFRHSDPCQTYNKEIFALCGGHTLTVTPEKLLIEKYWTPKPLGKYHFSSDEEWILCLKTLMYAAIEKRLDIENPVGVTLSGGLDSASIACILSDLLAKRNKPLYAFSSVLPATHSGVEEDERKYIQMVNDHCPNIIQTFIEVPERSPFDNPVSAFENDEAFPNVFYYTDAAILENAQQKGVRSLYTGYGGDFWVSWSGSSAIYQLINEGKWKQAFALLKAVAQQKGIGMWALLKMEYIGRTTGYKYWQKLLHPHAVNWDLHCALQPDFVNKFPESLPVAPPKYQLNDMFNFIASGRIGRLLSTVSNRNAAYQISAHEIMLDKEILEFLMDVPVSIFRKGGWSRSLIRHAMEGVLPKGIQWRTDKMPYDPDYLTRMIRNKEKVDVIMRNPNYDFVFDRYINKEYMTTYFDLIKPHSGFSARSSTYGIRISQAMIATILMGQLKAKGYHF